MPRVSYTKAVSVNYFLCVCAGCEVTQSCIITILNKLPNLTALGFYSIDLHANEREVSMHNVQMQCIHVCAVTQPAQHACVHSLACQMSQEGRGVQYLQPGFMAMDIPVLTYMHTCSQSHCASKVSTVSWGWCSSAYAPSIHHMTLGLASCPSRDVRNDVIYLNSSVMEHG